MHLDDGVVADASISLSADLEELRHGLLPIFMAPLCLVPVAWAAYASSVSTRLTYVDLAVVPLALAAFLALQLRNKKGRLASVVLMLGLAIANALVVAGYPDYMIMSFGLLIPMMSYALLGAKTALLVGVLSWAGQVAAWLTLTQAPFSETRAFAVLGLYLIALAVAWLSARPLRASVGWATASWEHSRQLLAETRERRFELYRALRALEEATYRVERMNHELLLARREADEARKQKARFVAIISHELRGPLNLILGYSRLMAMSPESYPEILPSCYRTDVASIYRNSGLLTSLIDDILDLSQIEAERLPLVKERTDLQSHVIDEVLSAIEPLAERKGLTINKQIPQDVPTLIADRVRLRQVLLNLLMNAVRLTENGSITLEVIPAESEVRVVVRDTGPGIAEDEIGQIFQEFHRREGAGTRAEKGTGLGLPICRQLIELHGGRITVESELGVGTAFTFTLPISASPGVTPGHPDGLNPASAPQRDCVIIQASTQVVRLLGRYLDEYQVLGINNPQELHDIVAHIHPRAILTSSQEAPALQAWLPDSFDVPILSCPSLGDTSQADHILTYLAKPVSPDALYAVMRRVERAYGETSVLIVDDEPDAARLVEHLLTAMPRPYRIVRVHNGAQALSIMQEEPPDVVLLDMAMPEMDGAEVVAAMRLDPALKGVPVVFISGHDLIDGQLSLETPITLSRRRPLGMAASVSLLKGMLETVGADYLGEQALPESFPTVHRG